MESFTGQSSEHRRQWLVEGLALLDWSGRAIHPHKQGTIHDELPPILDRLQIDPRELLRHLARQATGFHHVVGSESTIRRIVARLGHHFLKGISAANRLFAEPA